MRPSDVALEGARRDDTAGARAARPSQTVAAWMLLLAVDVVEKTLGFWRVYRVVGLAPTLRRSPHTSTAAARRVCGAVDAASVYYFRRVRCLQSAAAAVCLLRLHGIAAELVIGIRRLPFGAHAWVEVDRQVVMNEQPEMGSLYQVIARC